MKSTDEKLREYGCKRVSNRMPESRFEISELKSAIVFVVASWSGQSKAGLYAIAKAISSCEPELILIDNDNVDHDWIRPLFFDCPANHWPLHGYGEALWVRDGQVVATSTFRSPISDQKLAQLVEKIAH